MDTTNSSQPRLVRRTRLLAITGIACALALSMAIGVAVLLPSTSHPVHASGIGSGCYATSGPACTFKGSSASAQFESDSACTNSGVFVFATQNLSRSDGTATQSTFINVETFNYNNCTGAYTSGFGESTTVTVVGTKPDGTLSAQGQVIVQTYSSDGTMSSTPYTVNLTWKGFGKPSRQIDSFHFQSPEYSMQGHFVGTSQNAIVSGTLSDGTTNFAASPSSLGEQISADSGTFVTMQK